MNMEPEENGGDGKGNPVQSSIFGVPAVIFVRGRQGEVCCFLPWVFSPPKRGRIRMGKSLPLGLPLIFLGPIFGLVERCQIYYTPQSFTAET